MVRDPCRAVGRAVRRAAGRAVTGSLAILAAITGACAERSEPGETDTFEFPACGVSVSVTVEQRVHPLSFRSGARGTGAVVSTRLWRSPDGEGLVSAGVVVEHDRHVEPIADGFLERMPGGGTARCVGNFLNATLGPGDRTSVCRLRFVASEARPEPLQCRIRACGVSKFFDTGLCP